ncbi:MAG: lipopolysaccharide kinase InaA family protein, partial [Thermonemataceae bacterium]|nr:lipopolysaccharide kinase InaA family protein [Thermonemataceae bacterium]
MNHDLVGDRIANYDVKKKVSSDSLFDYYEAEHIFLQRKVILKTPREGIAEIEAAKAELHRQIAQPDFLHNQSSFIWDYFEDSGKVYIATEKQAERVSLEVYIAKNQHLTQEKTLRIFNQLTEIIYAAHQIGLVHLALNPKNIFIENEQLHIEAFSNTALQEENYRSPEELKSGEVSILSNIYSLGKILEFLFTNADAKLKNTNMLSHKFKEVIAIATEHNPKERFANGKEFLEALSEEVSEEEIENKNAFKGLPIVLFITFSVFFLLITFNIADEEDKKNTLAYDLYDQTRIRKSLDSIKKVRKNELIRDSIRIARNKAENLQKIHIHK